MIVRRNIIDFGSALLFFDFPEDGRSRILRNVQFIRLLIPEDEVFISTIVNTVELQLTGLIGTVSHPNVQIIRIIGFLFENRLQWQFEVEKISTNSDFRIHIYLRTNKMLI
jgi:hypothetical protein